MATLERIRQRSGLLLIVIGLAMAAFILTDLFSSGNSVLRNDANKVGEINGKSIDAQEFSKRIDERMELLKAQNPQQAANLSRTMVANQIWTEYQEEVLLSDRYADLGIKVTNQELFERIISNPQVRSQSGFVDEVTGKFSPAALKNYITNIRDNAGTDPQSANAYNQWLSFEDGTREQAERDKYLYAVRKGIYMPKALAQIDYTRRNESTSLQYFGLEYSSIADSTIEVSESEMKSYYNDHKEEFKSDNTREIAFVTFNVQASESDRAALKKELETYLAPEVINSRGRVDTLPSFQNAEDDSTYAVGRSDRQVNPTFKTKDQFTAPMDSILFAAEEGFVYGPYEQNGTFVLSKISEITDKPDSVQARHILLSFQGANQGQSQSTRQPMDAKNLADSLLALVQEDSTQFGALAKQYSDDPGSGAKGGVLGWFKPGAMVPSFNDYCFYNETGDIGLVFSQFGFHIIHIQDQKGANKAIKLVDIVREIEASDRTMDSIYKKADEFAAKASEMADFGAAAEEMGYVSRPASNIEPMQESILGVGNNREMVRWIHNEETELGAIQLFNQDNASFIVTQLVEIRPEGFLPLNLVEDQVRTAVINEKKAAQLAEDLEARMGAEIDIKALAVAFSKEVQSQSVNFGTSNLTGYGSEPKVIGMASGLAIGEMSEVIEGDRGVYVIYIASRNPAEELNSYQSEQIRVETGMSNAASAQVLESLKAAADIVDQRHKIF
jgi:parvulin-like peptidyl-prolyl isomerase